MTERTLKKWRKEALKFIEGLKMQDVQSLQWMESMELNNRILRMTQELMDLHLMKGR
jgi:hypothetical protein